MKRTLALTTVLFLFSTLFIVGVCVAGPPESTPTKPFVAQWTGTLYNVGVCPFEPQRYALTVNFGQGSATVLGPASFVFMYCIDPTSSVSGYGWGVVTTANGDKLYARITDLTVTPGDPITGTPTTWSENEQLLGGTGRFENASGNSKSSGIWGSADGFPIGFTVSPELLGPPAESGVQNWIGTTTGEFRF